MQAQTAVGVATAAVTVGYPLFQAITTKVKNWYYDYSEAEMKEVEQIRDYFKQYCFPNEQHGTLTTMHPQMRAESENNRDFPVYFQMDEANPKQPMFYIKKLKTIISAEDWNRYVNTDSFLTSTIKDMIGRVCNYQDERNRGSLRITETFGVGGKGYSYDPTNLFFEEFKMWLVELSKAPLNENTLNVVEGRMEFLRAIDVHQVFKQSGRDVTRHKTVIRLLDDLSGGIQPMITAAMAAEGAREHFKKLTTNLENLIWETTKFCFYIFRDTEDTPRNFILKELATGSLNYKKTVTGTRSGKLLFDLFNSPLIKMIDQNLVGNDLSPLMLTFAREDGPTLLLEAQGNEKLEMGVLQAFQDQPTLRQFYRLYGHIERLHVFRKIASDLYNLSGEGGNILVYGYAAPQTRHVLMAYRTLLGELESTINNLHSIADEHRRKLVDLQQKPSTQETRWLGIFVNIDSARDNLCHRRRGLFATSLGLVRNIEEKMESVNTPKYKNDLRNKINAFKQWMSLFLGAKIEIEGENEEVEVVAQPAVTPVKLLELPPPKKVLQTKIGNEVIQFSLKKLNGNEDDAFFAIEHSRDECIRLILEVCETQPYCNYLNAEVRHIFKGKPLPLTFSSHNTANFIQYNSAVEKNSHLKVQETCLDFLCLKTPGFLKDYIQYRYHQMRGGIPYVHKDGGLLHALALVFGQNFHVLQLGEEDNLLLLDSFVCKEQKYPPVYLLLCPGIQKKVDYPYFDCLLDLKNLAITHSKMVSVHGFFDADDNTVLDRAEKAYEASQMEGLKRDEWQKNLRVATECMNNLVERQPKNPKYLMLRGKYIASTGDPAKRALGINDFNLALENCRNDAVLRVQILIERGITHEFTYNIDKALEDFNSVLLLDPNCTMIRLKRGKLLVEEKQDKQNGMADYNYVLERNKDDLDALKARYRAAMFLEDYTLARTDALRMKQLKPEDPDIEVMEQQAFLKSTKIEKK